MLLYHVVCPAKYRRKVFTESVSKTLKDVCLGLTNGYEIQFVEIGADEDHIHFLIQSVPTMSVRRIVQLIKSVTAREIFRIHPEVKKLLWGGQFWTSGYYANTVGQYGSAKVIGEYVKNQGQKYEKIHAGQIALFEGI